MKIQYERAKPSYKSQFMSATSKHDRNGFKRGIGELTKFFKIVAMIIISPLMGLKQSIAYAMAMVGSVVTARPENP